MDDRSLGLGTGTHVAVTHDGSIFKFHKNGTQTEAGRIETDGVTGTLYIGGTDRHSGGFWHGMIDELLIFDHALGVSEIRQLNRSAKGHGAAPSSDRTRPRPSSVISEAPKPTDFKGIWRGMAVDKPQGGTSRDTLAIEFDVNEAGRLTGTASGEFVRGGRAQLKNLRASGNRLSFEVAHRIANLRMNVSLELKDGRLKGEAQPIDFRENACDIVLLRESSLVVWPSQQ